MGTRSVHFFPDKSGQIRYQYLQFDGYPSVQIFKFLDAFNREALTKKGRKIYHPTHPYNRDVIVDFLEAYYKCRSFDSPHSFGESDVVDKARMKQIIDSCDFGANYYYVWHFDVHDVLKLTVHSDGKEVLVDFEPLFDGFMPIKPTEKQKFADEIQAKFN